jgi:hypothetical protein
MKRYLTLAAFLGATACAVPIIIPLPLPPAEQEPAPTAMPQSAKARFVSSVEANGCALTSANTDLIMADAVLSREDLARVMTELRADGQGAIDGQAFRLTTGACA